MSPPSRWMKFTRCRLRMLARCAQPPLRPLRREPFSSASCSVRLSSACTNISPGFGIPRQKHLRLDGHCSRRRGPLRARSGSPGGDRHRSSWCRTLGEVIHAPGAAGTTQRPRRTDLPLRFASGRASPLSATRPGRRCSSPSCPSPYTRSRRDAEIDLVGLQHADRDARRDTGVDGVPPASST
jgi:hypothetical protein